MFGPNVFQSIRCGFQDVYYTQTRACFGVWVNIVTDYSVTVNLKPLEGSEFRFENLASVSDVNLIYSS
jgi:hypothetical protein